MNSSNFWIQLIERLFSSNPKFFKYIQYVSLAISAITGLPDLLGYFGIHLTGTWLVFENKIIAISGIVAALIAQLPNPNTPATPAVGTNQPAPTSK
ncbi:MAG: hypothetical protein EO766_13325 [Hydrotalea sp. AMD]|uniref:hypothetical protein n=1 Tax=Hydrotalea sp. AMD TaxID=2501297 RepID=UPI00102552F1|nr:hypothetical protein [Hydrotalea sp. AMD]RWZ86782.1 MAG: hypothetical protein EO766_13325 [Hydrotalea sp. AMD]